MVTARCRQSLSSGAIGGIELRHVLVSVSHLFSVVPLPSSTAVAALAASVMASGDLPAGWGVDEAGASTTDETVPQLLLYGCAKGFVQEWIVDGGSHRR